MLQRLELYNTCGKCKTSLLFAYAHAYVDISPDGTDVAKRLTRRQGVVEGNVLRAHQRQDFYADHLCKGIIHMLEISFYTAAVPPNLFESLPDEYSLAYELGSVTARCLAVCIDNIHDFQRSQCERDIFSSLLRLEPERKNKKVYCFVGYYLLGYNAA
jgi:hypothetical protein